MDYNNYDYEYILALDKSAEDTHYIEEEELFSSSLHKYLLRIQSK